MPITMSPTPRYEASRQWSTRSRAPQRARTPTAARRRPARASVHDLKLLLCLLRIQSPLRCKGVHILLRIDRQAGGVDPPATLLHIGDRAARPGPRHLFALDHAAGPRPILSGLSL